jgi:hypothetical protein
MKILRSRDEKEAAGSASAEYERFLAVLQNGAPEQVRAEVAALVSSGAASLTRKRTRFG